MRFSFFFSLIVCIASGAGSATAAPILYNLNFTTTSGLAPTGGSFLYDSTTSLFSAFTVQWAGGTFDFTILANAPAGAAVACDVLPTGPSSTDSFSALQGPSVTCGGDVEWRTLFFSEGAAVSMILAKSFGFAMGTKNAPVIGTPPNSTGTLRASLATVPEPSTAMLALVGGLGLWAGRRRGKNVPKVIASGLQ